MVMRSVWWRGSQVQKSNSKSGGGLSIPTTIVPWQHKKFHCFKNQSRSVEHTHKKKKRHNRMTLQTCLRLTNQNHCTVSLFAVVSVCASATDSSACVLMFCASGFGAGGFSVAFFLAFAFLASAAAASAAASASLYR